MIDQLIQLGTGAAGGLVGGNALGAAFRGRGVGAGQSSLVGMIVGAAATYFFGPTLGPIIAGIVGSGGLDAILGNLLSGAGGGAAGTLIWGLIRSMMGGGAQQA